MQQEAFHRQFGKNLNPQQKEAVYTVDGRVLLLAVPGSGKTTVLVTRLGYMVRCAEIPPEQILTMTFTTAAAREMQARFCRLFGEESGRRMVFCTINSLCNRIIYDIGRRSGRPPFSLIGEAEAGNQIRRIYQQLNKEFATDNVVKDVSGCITYIKNMGLTEKEIREKDFGIDRMAEIYQAYNRTLREKKQMDFDDQLVYAATILKTVPGALEHYRNRFRYLCVDEAQDTSRLQHEIIQMLVGKQGNLFMVGDEDQSIYGFRGAYPAALLQFSQIYPGGRILTMEENYRSAEPVVQVANGFIAKNELRHKKIIRPTQGPGKPVEIIPVMDRDEQYAYLLKHLQAQTLHTAVLYRNNDSALPLMDLLERRGIPYCCTKSDTGFFTHRILTDIREILQFAGQTCNTGIFMDIYYKIGLRITKELARYVCARSEETGEPIPDVLMEDDRVPAYGKEKAMNLQQVLSHVTTWKPYAVLGEIWNALDYGSYVKDRKLDGGKYQILRILARQEDSCQSFLNRLEDLRYLMDSHRNPQNCSLTLSTIHSSKGLEYPSVYLLDVVDGILPQETEEEMEDLQQHEEDRRVCYVGITRAQRELHLFQCRQNHSEFIRNIRSILNGEPEKKPLPVSPGQKSRLQPVRELPPQQLKAAVGLQIRHKTMGPGTIREVNGDLVTIWMERENRTVQFSWHTILQKRLLEL